MSHYTNLKLEIADHTAVVTLSNPGANTFTRDGLMALTQLVHDLNANRDVVSLVITGQGEKFFSAAVIQSFASLELLC